MPSPSDHTRPEPPKRWTVLSLVEWGARYLEERGCDESRLHTDLLLAHVLGIPRMSLYLQFDRPLTEDELARFKPLFLRRAAREPLQYVLGETEFMNVRLKTDLRALIPRPETELLVERAVAFLKSKAQSPSRVLDIGTGSGNIAISIAKEVPGSVVTGVDISAEALALAQENAALNAVADIRWVILDIMQDSIQDGMQDSMQDGLYTLIVTNPPYIPMKEYEELPLEIRQFEPAGALTDGGDGLSFIRRITRLASGILERGGALFSEIAYNQEEAALRLSAEAGLTDAVVHRDHAGHPRILEARRKESNP